MKPSSSRSTSFGTDVAVGVFQQGSCAAPISGCANAEGDGACVVLVRDLSGTTTSHSVRFRLDQELGCLTLPDAIDDAFTILSDTRSNVFTVLRNDDDAQCQTGGANLEITAITNPAHGVATITGGGTTITYTPDAGFVGEDILSYTVVDTTREAPPSTATVTVSVEPFTLERAGLAGVKRPHRRVTGIGEGLPARVVVVVAVATSSIVADSGLDGRLATHPSTTMDTPSPAGGGDKTMPSSAGA